jgi:thiosulfate/3-mercaptopyruvate sulfurtransferase
VWAWWELNLRPLRSRQSKGKVGGVGLVGVELTTMYTTLIETSELAELLQRLQLRSPPIAAGVSLIDCRFDLSRPDSGAAAYATGHIPGAVYAHLDHDLSGPVTPQSGRHPLPSREAFATTLGRLGVDRSAQVIAYDQGNGAHAARLWWLLRWMGHSRVAVLNGGFAAWQQAGLPVSTEPVSRRASFAERPASEAAVTTAEVTPKTPGDAVTTAELIGMLSAADFSSGRRALVDARGADRFAGQNETIDPVAGHIPGARNHPFTRNLDASGRFLGATELRKQWLRTLGGTQPADVITMCGSGVTACHNLLALEVAGLPGARLYAGSWSEWIRDPRRPIAVAP